jgi:hypothetical protein
VYQPDSLGEPGTLPLDLTMTCPDPAPAMSFDQLVAELKAALGPSSGLNSADVDVDELAMLMQRYDSSERGWIRYAFKDGSRGYTRNLVDEGNGKSNLVGGTVSFVVPSPATQASSPSLTPPIPTAHPGLVTWQGQPDP